MVNGVKVSLVYHLYCKDAEAIAVGTGNVYNEINRRCLEHFHDVFDDAVFCVCVDDRTDSELIQKAVAWIWSCGFKDNVTIKVKPNTPYRDAQTFYDEVVDHLDEFEGMVFFGHNKGGTHPDCKPVRQWVAFSYYACLDKIGENINDLSEYVCMVSYVPMNSTFCMPNGWLPPGSYFLFNPKKIAQIPRRFGTPLPELGSRFSGEQFFSDLIDIKNPPYGYETKFESWQNGYLYGYCDYYVTDHIEIISRFLPPERVADYQSFYDQITEGLPKVSEG